MSPRKEVTGWCLANFCIERSGCSFSIRSSLFVQFRLLAPMRLFNQGRCCAIAAYVPSNWVSSSSQWRSSSSSFCGARFNFKFDFAALQQLCSRLARFFFKRRCSAERCLYFFGLGLVDFVVAPIYAACRWHGLHVFQFSFFHRGSLSLLSRFSRSSASLRA